MWREEQNSNKKEIKILKKYSYASTKTAVSMVTVGQ